MPYSFTEKKRIRKSFAKRPSGQKVPFLLSRPLNASYRKRASDAPLHNYDIFDFALNGVE